MPRHGDVIVPKEQFVTYAHQMSISDEVLEEYPQLERRFLTEARVRAHDAAAKIDPYAPVKITLGPIHILPKPNPFTTRWGVHIRVEFLRYVYDDTKRLAQEWERIKHRYI